MGRKRSQHVHLVLLVSAALVVGGCDGRHDSSSAQTYETVSVEEPVFRSLAECQERYTAVECDLQDQIARGNHERTAPRYASAADCEAVHGAGQCGASRSSTFAGTGGTPHASSVFIPTMLGFMTGAAVGAATGADSGSSRARPVYAAPMTPEQQRCASPNGARDPSCPTRSGGGAHAMVVTSYASGGRTLGPVGSSGRSFTAAVTRPVAAMSSASSAAGRGGFGASASAHVGGGGS